MTIAFADSDLDSEREQLRARLRKMSDAELLRYGKAGALHVLERSAAVRRDVPTERELAHAARRVPYNRLEDTVPVWDIWSDTGQEWLYGEGSLGEFKRKLETRHQRQGTKEAMALPDARK